MSSSGNLGQQQAPSYYLVEDEDDLGPVNLARAEARRSFRDRWRHGDTVLALIDELLHTGREREAAAIQRVLGYDDDEEAMRAYVSRLWAEDWDCPEDGIFDQL